MNPERARRRMVEQLRRYGIRDERVLAAMAAVPREAFVPEALAAHAYEDGALPLERGQTISQPYIVARMAEAAHPAADERVLEVGTGSGYGAAVLARLADHVVTVERIGELAASARHRLADLDVDNVEVIEADGTLGWPPGAPYDAIVVTAAGPTVPAGYLGQLGEGGRLVMPVGEEGAQELVLVEPGPPGRRPRQQLLGPVAFVPLIGEEGFRPR